MERGIPQPDSFEDRKRNSLLKLLFVEKEWALSQVRG